MFPFLKNNNDKKTIIPNFVGVNGTPKFPVTDDYARHTLMIHKPWTTCPTHLDWIAEFNNFINRVECPKSARLSYERVMHRYFENMQHYEPTTSSADHTKNILSEDDRTLLDLYGKRGVELTDHEESLLKSFDHGREHEWDKEPTVSSISCHQPFCYMHAPCQVINHSVTDMFYSPTPLSILIGPLWVTNLFRTFNHNC